MSLKFIKQEKLPNYLSVKNKLAINIYTYLPQSCLILAPNFPRLTRFVLGSRIFSQPRDVYFSRWFDGIPTYASLIGMFKNVPKVR